MEILTYHHARVYLESLIRPFASIVSPLDGAVITPLERMRVFLKRLDNPHLTFRSVVVTGSAGKGSTAYLLSHVLTKGGYRIGLTTSPHLQKLNERVQINEQEISDNDLIFLVREIQQVVIAMKSTIYGEPSYYESLAAIAFLYFSRQKVDLAVVEVGLEGKYEASNLLLALGVIWTNVSLDHTDILGETVEEIAQETVSAVARTGGGEFLVTGVQPSFVKSFGEAKPESVAEMIIESCKAYNTEVAFLSKDFSFSLIETDLAGSVFDFSFGDYVLKRVHLSLIGEFQVENVSLVLAGLFYLKRFGFSISERVVRSALKNVFYSGRFERISYSYKKKTYEVILDGAHSEARMQALVRALSTLYPQRRKIFVLAFKGANRIREMLQAVIPIADVIISTEFNLATDMKRYASFPSCELLQMITSFSDDSLALDEDSQSSKAFFKALDLAEPEDVVVVTGSLYLVAEVRAVVGVVGSG